MPPCSRGECPLGYENLTAANKTAWRIFLDSALLGGAGFYKDGRFDLSNTFTSGLDAVLKFQNVYYSETARDRFYNRLKLIIGEVNTFNNKIAEKLEDDK